MSIVVHEYSTITDYICWTELDIFFTGVDRKLLMKIISSGSLLMKLFQFVIP